MGSCRRSQGVLSFAITGLPEISKLKNGLGISASPEETKCDSCSGLLSHFYYYGSYDYKVQSY